MGKLLINGKVFVMDDTRKQKRLNRDRRKAEVMIAVEKAYRAGKVSTVHSVAKATKVSASTRLRTIMNELVSDGSLLRFEGIHWNGVKRFTYMPDLAAYKNNHPNGHKLLVAQLGEQERMF